MIDDGWVDIIIIIIITHIEFRIHNYIITFQTTIKTPVFLRAQTKTTLLDHVYSL